MEGDIDGVSGPPSQLPEVINIPTKRNTHHYLFNQDGTFNFDPFSLPEGRSKPVYNNNFYHGEGLPNY